MSTQGEQINHPAHYGGDTVYEAIKVIEAWGLGFCLGNTVKYISRAGKKDPMKGIEDLEKARWYLDHEIGRMKMLMNAATIIGAKLLPPKLQLPDISPLKPVRFRKPKRK